MHKGFLITNFVIFLYLFNLEIMSSSGMQEHLKTVLPSCHNFSHQFYKILASITEENVATSPLSIHIILSLLSHGAQGTTLSEMKSGLHLVDLVSSQDGFKALIKILQDIEKVELNLANTLYVQEDVEFSSEFMEISKEVFACTVSKVDFKNNVEAAKQINLWIEQATNKKISDMVSSDDLDEETKLLLINAIYFKGDWLHKFDVKHTTNKEFHVTKTESKMVSTMFKKCKYPHGQLMGLDADFIEIPYVNEDLALIVILPREIDGLRSLERNFYWDSLKTAERFHTEIALFLPKFKLEAKIDLEESLRKLGLETMFEDSADFSQLTSIPLKVGNAIQKVYIQVDEEGCVAAAATVVQMRLKRSFSVLEEFLVDRPFMIAIHHRPSDIPLFVGSVRDIPASTIVHEDL